MNRIISEFRLNGILGICILWRYFWNLSLTALFYKLFFKKIGTRTCIYKPLKINGASNITLGKRVIIEKGTWLAAAALTNDHRPELVIGNGTVIGHFNHIYSTSKIELGNNVLTADRVYISDNLHEYSRIDLPIIHQPIKQIGKVYIGDGTWIGEHACILGVEIGKNCVIGANSVVTKNIPDFCVVVGAPARIIKRYCLKNKEWKKTDPHGAFLN